MRHRARQGSNPQRFPVRFYLVAMIFIIFDIEVVFLYPWAIDFRQLRVFGLVEVLVFAVVVIVAFLYLVSNGALQLGPGPPARAGRCPLRTSESTISAGSPQSPPSPPGRRPPERAA